MIAHAHRARTHAAEIHAEQETRVLCSCARAYFSLSLSLSLSLSFSARVARVAGKSSKSEAGRDIGQSIWKTMKTPRRAAPRLNIQRLSND
jgi:hypothetical protein